MFGVPEVYRSRRLTVWVADVLSIGDGGSEGAARRVARLVGANSELNGALLWDARHRGGGGR